MCIRDRNKFDQAQPKIDAMEPFYQLIDVDLARDELGIISCLLYTSDAADERSSVDLGGRRIIKKHNK